MLENQNKLIILGSGPAGYSRNIRCKGWTKSYNYCWRQEGGQLTTTTDVENWPGDSDGLQGPELMERMKKHALQFDVQVINDHINSVDLSNQPFKLYGNSEYECESLIISTGASAMYLVCLLKKNIWEKVFQLVPHVMDFFIEIKKLQ